MKVEKVFWNGEEVVSRTEAQRLYEKYVKDMMTNECFFGGIEIHTEDGILQAEVTLN